MRLITLLLISATIILACNIGKNNSSLFTPDNLEASQYVINTDRDTTIETKNGALLKIPRGAMTPDDGKTVTLEIKEAYTLEQMIKGGLTTGSNGDPLSSGGMIYINAADGQNISINQKIQVAIPTDFLQKGMQLFKGKTNNKGDINWIDPVALPENKKANAIAQGEVIFQTKCAGCHAIGKELSGPDLAHFPKRIPDNEGTSMYWHHAFKKQDTPYTIADTTPARRQYLYEDIYTDQYSCNLIHMYGGKAVNLSNEFDNNLFQVYNYIQYESYRRKLELPRHAYLFD
jgi:hypothetical protein